MGRRLPDDPVKRRTALFKNMYGNYFHWQSLVETDGITVITLEGEELYFYDVMVGIITLPPRQKEAFELHVLQGLSEEAAAKEMGFVRWSTPVQQYVQMALEKMIKAYDEYQRGIKPRPYVGKGAPKHKKKVSS